MEGSFILCFAAMMLFMAPGVKGTGHLSFANNTQVNITRAGCDVSKHCVATPDNCDPAGDAICLFGSAFATAPMAPNGADVTIQLSGNSSGYIALGLTANATEGTTMLFICAQNSSTNGTFFFATLQKNNNNNTDGMVTPKETRVTEIRGVVNGTLIQCEFTVPSVNATSTRSSDSSFQILLGSGTVVGDTLGAFKTAKESGLLNLADPMATTPAPPLPPPPPPPPPPTPAPTAAPTTATTTTATPTTAGASSVLHSYALLLLLSVVALSFTHRA